LDIKSRFINIAKQLEENESKIVNELNQAQGKPVNIGGYYKPNFELVTKAMRPSTTLNSIIDCILN